MTFSIIAYDPETQSWGIAVASRIMAIGAYVPHAKTSHAPGHAAPGHATAGSTALVASQSLVPNYGADLLDLLLSQGFLDPDSMRSIDPLLEDRQIAWIDGQGRVFYYVGAHVVPVVSQHASQRWHASAQGNMLSNSDVTAGMLETYVGHRRAAQEQPQPHEHQLDFAESLLAALSAGEAFGGDKRIHSPEYSAALLIVRPCVAQSEAGSGTTTQSSAITDQCKIDLRVDQAQHPIADLIALYRAWAHRAQTRTCEHAPDAGTRTDTSASNGYEASPTALCDEGLGYTSAEDGLFLPLLAPQTRQLDTLRSFVIVACMAYTQDSLFFEETLRRRYPRLRDANAWVIRNAGGRVTDDVVRSIIIAVRALNARDCFIIHHTCCGEYRTFTDEQMRLYLSESLGPCNAFYPGDPCPPPKSGACFSESLSSSSSLRAQHWPERDEHHLADHVAFLPYTDYRASVYQDMKRLKSQPLVSSCLRVHGLMYDDIHTHQLYDIADPIVATLSCGPPGSSR
jgi:uncharacterized Ntn-hydrolase superfamily protein